MPRPFFGLNRNLLHVRDEKASGTNGGTFTSGAWQTRDLNAVLTNEIQGAALSSNTITGLKAGVYEVWASAPGYRADRHQARLYDVTGAAALVLGTNAFSGSASDYTDSRSMVVGRFTLAATSTVRLEHRSQATYTTQGLGLATSWGVEVYADLQIRFLGT